MNRIIGRMSAVSLIVGLSCAGRIAAAAQQSVIYGVVQQRQDVFSGSSACALVDAQPSQASGIEAVVTALAPCMQELSRRYKVAVSAVKGDVGVDGGRSKAQGVLIQVPADIGRDCHILMDLSYSIREKRKGLLLGLPAGVWSGSLETPAPTLTVSLIRIPAWLDGESLRADAKSIKADVDGGLHAAFFDKDDNEVELTAAAAAPAGEASVTFTKATDDELGPYRVAILEAAQPGALKRILSAVPLPAGLDVSTRKAVQGFIASLPGDDAR
jgi:hypothetical protein